MKIKYFFLLLVLLSFGACKDTKDDEIDTTDPEEEKHNYVNNWIYDELDEYYLWDSIMPAKASLKLNIDPYDFFESVLWSEDRFSYLEGTHVNIPKSTSAENNPVSSDIGFEYVYIRYVNQAGTPTGEWAYLVVYVKKDTDAEKQGIKRGHLITKVNDAKITDSNRIELLYQNLGSYKLSVQDVELGKSIEKTVNVTYNYTENPNYLNKIFTVNGKNVGYIVYNSFKAGAEETLPYDVELMNILARFQSEGVTDLILDLRYNGGGLVRSAQFLASALVPDRSTENLFEIKTYNRDIQKWLNPLPKTNPTKISWMYDFFVDNVVTKDNKTLKAIPKLGDQLNNLYVLCTNSTASASEMVVNTLRPYMQEKGKNVILVGQQTRGKNVGSWAIYEDDKPENTYVMWPIIFQSHNKNMESNYSGGFRPDVDVNELLSFLSDGKPLKELGDENEVLLNAALSTIKGEFKSLKSTGTPKFIEEGSSLDQKVGANKMYESKNKSQILKNQLKSLKEQPN